MAEPHSPFPENKLDTLGLFSWNPSASGESVRVRVVASLKIPHVANVFLLDLQFGLGPVDDKPQIHGRQFTTRPAKMGLGPDVTFSRFTSINVGDKFVSPEERRRYDFGRIS
eukprot:2604670-Rhodomonas_salina.3